MQSQTNTTGTFESTFQPILSVLSALVHQVSRRTNIDVSVDLHAMLEALPIGSDEFRIACNRLPNAQRYLASNEFNAAQWEINAMRQQLKSQAFAPSYEPRRRLRKRDKQD